jgi:hypothetical protein
MRERLTRRSGHIQEPAQRFPTLFDIEYKKLLWRNDTLYFFLVSLIHSNGVWPLPESTVEEALPDLPVEETKHAPH